MSLVHAKVFFEEPPAAEIDTHEPKRSNSVEIKSKPSIKIVIKNPKTKRRMEIREMSRRAFRSWCKKHLRSIQLQNVAEEQSEHDSWEYISQRGQKNKESNKFMMQLRQFRLISI